MFTSKLTSFHVPDNLNFFFLLDQVRSGSPEAWDQVEPSENVIC